MGNINAGDEGAMEFIIASQQAGKTWLENLENKINDALKEFDMKMLFFHHYEDTFWIIPVSIKTDRAVFLGNYFEKIAVIEKEKEESVIKILSDWYAYLYPSRNLVTIKGLNSPELETVKKVFTDEGLAVREG